MSQPTARELTPQERGVEAQLVEQLATLEARLERIDAHQHNAGREVSRDWDDRAIQRQNDEVVEALLPHTVDEIAAIRSALARLHAGESLICVECGDPIPAKRLAIIPETHVCADCAG
ncbi:MAG: TraR/DksA family transcriptional regulator [Myxococcota bacterium]